jgi:predicted nucleotidyltransferase
MSRSNARQSVDRTTVWRQQLHSSETLIHSPFLTSTKRKRVNLRGLSIHLLALRAGTEIANRLLNQTTKNREDCC